MAALTKSPIATGPASQPDAAEEPVTCELGYAPNDVVEALLRGAARLRRHLIITQELRSGSGGARRSTTACETRTPAATPIRTSGTRWYYTEEGRTIGSSTDQR